MNEFVKSESISGNRVRYTDSSGRSFIYNKGSRAWRNNNPGNIRPPKRTKLPGIIGKAGGFAVFASYELGFKSISILLKEPQYQKLSIFDAIADYAPVLKMMLKTTESSYFKLLKSNSKRN